MLAPQVDLGEKDVPGDVYQGVDQRAGHKRARPHPDVAVKQPSDRSQQHVLPVREWRMEDVRKAKDYRSDDQTRPRILERSREQILQQASE